MLPLRVLYFGTYDKNYARNRIMIEGLRKIGAEVCECHVPLWQTTSDKVAAANGEYPLTILVKRVLQAYVALLKLYRSFHSQYDVMMLGYAGQLDVFLARFLTWLARRPLVLDVFMSLYLIASERDLSRKNWLYHIENVACRFPDLLIIDTAEYAEWFEQTFGIPRQRFCLVPTGANDGIFRPVLSRRSDDKFRVVYYGSFIPLHGVEYIVLAAKLLQRRTEIVFELIGCGPERPRAQELVVALGLDNVIFTDWIAEHDLPNYLSRADVLLGVFGTTEQSKRTIQNKIYQGLAMALPVITGDSSTVRATFTHKQHVYLVERGNPEALASAILELQSDPALRTYLSKEGRRLFLKQFTVEQIGQRTLEHLYRLLQGK
jgi:glycosyltransferase involved in cell wall biosynthesis